MKSTRRINIAEIAFFTLVLTMFVLYFVVYLSDSKITWYKEMGKQIDILYFEATHIGR